jgi:hypothetical protein
VSHDHPGQAKIKPCLIGDCDPDEWQTRHKGALVMKYALIILVLTAPVFAQATAKEMTDAECASIIAQANRDAYYRTGRRCACPEGPGDRRQPVRQAECVQ